MHYRRLGHTDMRVSTMAFGCWAIAGGPAWGDQDEHDALDAIRSAYEEGVTLFDTAEAYGRGTSEELLGRGVAGFRDKVLLATKASPEHLAPADLRAACLASLRRLRTDRIDLYQLHWPSRVVAPADTIGAVQELRREGLIREWGISNFGPQDLADLLQAGGAPASNQVAYNLLFRAIEFEILPACRRQEIGILCYSPLLHGLLTGKFARIDDVPDWRRRTRHFSCERELTRHDESGAEAETFDAIARIREIAEGLGHSMADVCLAWLAAQEGVASAISGARNREQARRNAHAGDLKLPTDAIARLTQATDVLKLRLGPNADMWESESRMR